MAEAQPADQPYVFISYARADQGYVNDLIAHLADDDVDVWIDIDTDYGDSWPRAIRDRVDGCAAMVVVMTPTSEGSDWVPREIRRAQQQGKAILPLLLDGEPFFELNTTEYEDVTDLRMPSARFVERLTHLTSTGPPRNLDHSTLPTHGTAAVVHWLDEGTRLVRLGQYEQAVEAYDRAIELDPSNAHAHTRRGGALGRLGRDDEALEAYDRAIELDPGNAIAHTGRGAALGRLGRRIEALEAYERAIELDPDIAVAHTGLGGLLWRSDRNDEALETYDRVIELDPDNTHAHVHRGQVLATSGRNEEALEAYDRAIELDPDNAHAHQGRGALLGRMGRMVEGLKAHDHAVELAIAQVGRYSALRWLYTDDEYLEAYDQAIEPNGQ